jgi:hypothetical protein
MSRNSSVGTETSYRLEEKGTVLISGKGEIFFLLYRVRTGSGVNPTSYPIGPLVFFP